jgi:signal transduction histidine kinase
MEPASWASRDDGWWAAVAAVAAVVTGVVSAIALEMGQRILPVAAVTVVVAAGYLVRTRWATMPTPVLLAWTCVPPFVLNLAAGGEGTMFLLIIGLSYATLIQPDRRLRIAYGVVGVASPVIINQFAYDHWGWPYWTMGLLFGCLTSSQVRRYRLLLQELEDTRERLAEQAVDAERRRLATELHDLVGHSLTIVLLYLTGARRRVRDDPVQAEAALREAEEIGRRCLAETRQNIAVLRDGDEHGSVPTPCAQDVPGLVAEACSAGTEVALRVDGDLDQVEPMLGLAVFRVVQESLANATTHAGGPASM